MKKRGDIPLKALAVAIVSVMVILLLYRAGAAYGSGEVYYRLALAKDIALTIDLLYSLQGDVEYTYPNDISGYDIEIKDNLVKVYSKGSGRTDVLTATYSFAGTTFDKPDFIVSGDYLVIKKTSKSLKFSGISKTKEGAILT